MAGPFMGNGAANPDVTLNLWGEQPGMTLRNVFDDSLMAQDDFDYSEYLSAEYVWEMDENSVTRFDIPFDNSIEVNDNDHSNDSANQCQMIATCPTPVNPLKRSSPPDDEDSHDDGEDDHNHDNSAATTTSPTITTKPSKKRQRAIPGGFPCASCEKVFDRAADLNKHDGRAHRAEAQKPCACDKCSKRFLYPKDVVRHNRQMHGVVDTILQMSARAGAGRVHRGADGKPAYMTMATALVFSRSVVMLKGRLRLRRESTAAASASGDRFAMITTDKRNFRVLNVTNVKDHHGLLGEIRRELEIDEGRGFSVLRHVLGRDAPQLLSIEETMAALHKEADAHGTLKLFVSLIKSEPDDFY